MENISENSTDKKARFTFKKEERLTSKKIIDKLFSEGDSFLSFPLKIVFCKTELPTKSPAQSAFTVGKRNFKLAVHRNLIKRKMRETYRMQKHELYDALKENQLAVFFIFIGKEIPKYEDVNKAMQRGINKLVAEITLSKT